MTFLAGIQTDHDGAGDGDMSNIGLLVIPLVLHAAMHLTRVFDRGRTGNKRGYLLGIVAGKWPSMPLTIFAYCLFQESSKVKEYFDPVET